MTHLDFPGHHALVTGAGSGIGAGAAIALARAGADVTLVGRREAALQDTATAVRAAGRTATVVAADVTNPIAVGEAVRAGWEIAPLDLLVTSAGTNAPGSFAEATAGWARSTRS